MEYKVKTFEELTTKEFYELAKLRISVFVVEQDCPYQEIDQVDEHALHTWLVEDEVIMGYTRIFENGEDVTCGRVLVNSNCRKKKIGRQLLAKTLAVIEDQYPDQSIVISAQAHLIEFYGFFDFKVISEVYLEDDIPHVKMKRVARKPLG